MHKYLLLSVCGCLISLSANAFETKAKYAYLIDADTGFVMYDKKSDVAMAPASMSKLMTAYMMFDAIKNGRVSMEDEFIVSDNAWRKGGVKSGSSTMFLEPNKKVKVKDFGIGIKKSELENIWNRYYKVYDSQKKKSIGSGLGLAIVKQILETHNFEYGVNSEYSVGSEFWFIVPKENYIKGDNNEK